MLKKHQKTVKFTRPQIVFLEDLSEQNNSSIAEENRKIIDLYRANSLYDLKATAEIKILVKRFEKLIEALTEEDA